MSPFDAKTTELLHHYTTHVYISLSGNRNPGVWRVSMPQMALSPSFLLPGILALSALHISTLLPHRKHELQTLAIAQEGAALSSYRKFVKHPNAETIHSVFAFAGYMVPYILASPGGVGRWRLPSKEDAHPHWFQSMKDLMALLVDHWDELARGPFAAPLKREMGATFASDNLDDDQLAKLERMFPDSSPLSSPLLAPSSPFSSPPSDCADDEERKMEICKQALDELRRVSALPYSQTRTLCVKTSVHIWPGSVRQDFVQLIHERYPRALAVLVHYCVLLKRNDHVWYLRGVGEGLLDNIWEALGVEWMSWIQWAIEFLVCEKEPKKYELI
jgi:hypothetical protein